MSDHSLLSRDILLWKALCENDDQALGQLMQIHYKALLNYGYKFIKDEEFIKDCIQEVFIDLWNARHRVDIPVHVRAYLFVSLRRKMIRNKTKLPSFEERHAPINDESGLMAEFSPEWWLIEEETLSQKTKLVADLMNTLPVRQREVIYLKYYQDLSREEIAAVLSITPQTVSNLLQIAYAHLRKQSHIPSIGFFLALYAPLIISSLE